MWQYSRQVLSIACLVQLHGRRSCPIVGYTADFKQLNIFEIKDEIIGINYKLEL